MSANTAADVESICSKCGDVWHVVVAKVGDQIAKVQCKECGAYHRYRPPGGKKKAAAKPRKRTTKAKTTGARKSTKAKTALPDEPTIEADMSRVVREYGASQTYEPAERIEHPKFGIGVVETAADGKMQVFFPSGRRVLVQGKKAPKLERPAPFRHKTNSNGNSDANGGPTV